ncbi:MAG: YfhO family protein [Candidatus Omnitrophota bacterium]
MKKHIGFVLFFAAIIYIFLGDLIVMKSAFLHGDYLQQFYPWSKLYSQAIKNFSFPFWVRYFGCGFPLMAEGQVGGFYPLNMILFFALPFHIAYNYSIVLHFTLAGFFTYLYTRKLGADQWGGALAALLFCFGSGYAGCFYNIVTLKTLVWFPFVLFMFEKYFQYKKIKYLIISGVILGMQLLAGFAQMAAYSALFYFIYFVYGLITRRTFKLMDLGKLLTGLFVAMLIFLPQLLLSWPLIKLSGRTDSSLGFALWGSFNPLNLISLFFPSLIFYGAQIYIGIFSLIFLITAFANVRQKTKMWPLFSILFFSLFFALGAYNPFYVLFLKLTKFYSFRNPSKFIFFTSFSLSVLAGLGFKEFFSNQDIPRRAKNLKFFSLCICIVLLIFSLARLALYLFRVHILNVGKWYVTNYIFGKEYHRYDLISYLNRINGFYSQLFERISVSNIFTVISIIFCIFALFVVLRIMKREKNNNLSKPFFFSFIAFEIFIYSFYGIGFRGNIRTFNYLQPTHRIILEILQKDKEIFRILPFGLTAEFMPWWIKPNANIIVGLDSPAVYSPLAQRSYRKELSTLEVVDDSLGLMTPSEQALIDKYRLLKVLNVKYILSNKELKNKFLEKITFENGIFLYRLKGCLPRVFFTEHIIGDIKIDPPQALKVKVYKDGFMELEIIVQKKGFVVFSENYYPGWQAYIDGNKKEIVKVKDLIQGVAVKNGKHKVIFKYNPF